MVADEPSLPRPAPPPPPSWGAGAPGPSGPPPPPPPVTGAAAWAPPPGVTTRRHRFAAVVAVALGVLVALLALAPFAEVDAPGGHNVTFAGTPWNLLVLALAVALIVLGVRSLRSSRRIGSLVPAMALLATIPFTIAGMVAARDRADRALVGRPAFSATSNYSASPAVIIVVALVAAAAWFLRGVFGLMRRGGSGARRS